MRWFKSILVLVIAGTGVGCSSPDPERFQGYVEGDFVYMASSQPGQLTRLEVAPGQAVAASAVLFALESGTESAALRQAREQLRAAEATRADMASGKRPQELAVIDAQLQQARAESDRAARQLVRDEAQAAIGGAAQAQVDDARAAAQSASAKVRELSDQLAVARLPTRAEQVAAQAAEVEAARAAVAQAQWRLDQKVVLAPDAGLVFDTMYRAGEWVPAGSPVVRMLPPGNVKVRFFLPEAAIGRIAPGRAVTIRCDGCAAEVPAVVSFVSSQAEFTPPVIYSNETRAKLVFLVEARPAVENAPKLRPGQPVSVVLQ